MAKIVVVPVSMAKKIPFLSKVRDITGLGMAAISKSVSDQSPLAEYPIWFNDHDDMAKKLRGLMKVDQQGLGKFQFFELGDDEDFESCPKDKREVSVGVLKNILSG